MADTIGRRDRRSVELCHQYVGGDGAAAVDALVDGFRHESLSLEHTQYDNCRLRVKGRILQQEPPDAWIGWPGGELRGYVDAGTVRDVSDLWAEAGLEDRMRPFAAEACRLDGSYHAVPLTVHRVNDCYVNLERCEAAGFDPTAPDDPAEFAEALAGVADDVDAAPVLVPMSDPFVVLQLWEVTLLGLTDHRTFRAVGDGDADRHRDAVRSALRTVERLAGLAPDDALYRSLTAGNDGFVAGEGLVYPQGDWAAGAFVETPDFAFGEDWDRIPFPGTDGQYVIVMDAVVPSAAAGDAVDEFLAYAASPEAQAEFNRLKGSLPPHADAPRESFSAFGRDQARRLDRSTAQPETIAHGLRVTPAQLVELKAAIAEFVDDWDLDRTADAVVEILDAS